jgi:predicted transcriptional regulator YdeE
MGFKKMLFKGISREFSLLNEDQYNTIGDFWDEMSLLYGLENLQGLGYKWSGGKIFYAIGLKSADIDGYNLCIDLPDENWTLVNGETEKLREIYNEIYKSGPLKYEIETFDENGKCQIKYYR